MPQLSAAIASSYLGASSSNCHQGNPIRMSWAQRSVVTAFTSCDKIPVIAISSSACAQPRSCPGIAHHQSCTSSTPDTHARLAERQACRADKVLTKNLNQTIQVQNFNHGCVWLLRQVLPWARARSASRTRRRRRLRYVAPRVPSCPAVQRRAGRRRRCGVSPP